MPPLPAQLTLEPVEGPLRSDSAKMRASEQSGPTTGPDPTGLRVVVAATTRELGPPTIPEPVEGSLWRAAREIAVTIDHPGYAY